MSSTAGDPSVFSYFSFGPGLIDHNSFDTSYDSIPASLLSLLASSDGSLPRYLETGKDGFDIKSSTVPYIGQAMVTLPGLFRLPSGLMQFSWRSPKQMSLSQSWVELSDTDILGRLEITEEKDMIFFGELQEVTTNLRHFVLIRFVPPATIYAAYPGGFGTVVYGYLNLIGYRIRGTGDENSAENSKNSYDAVSSKLMVGLELEFRQYGSAFTEKRVLNSRCYDSFFAGFQTTSRTIDQTQKLSPTITDLAPSADGSLAMTLNVPLKSSVTVNLLHIKRPFCNILYLGEMPQYDADANQNQDVPDVAWTLNSAWVLPVVSVLVVIACLALLGYAAYRWWRAHRTVDDRAGEGIASPGQLENPPPRSPHRN